MDGRLGMHDEGKHTTSRAQTEVCYFKVLYVKSQAIRDVP